MRASRARMVPVTLLLSGGLLLAGPLQAQDYDAEREELEELRSDLAAIEEALEADRAEHDEVEAEISELERQVSSASRKVAELREEQSELADRVDELRAEYEAKSEELSEHQDTLAEQIVAAYISGGRGQLRLLLSEQEPATAQRLLVYHDYFNEARAEQIQIASEALRSLAALRRELQAEMESLERVEAETLAEQERLEERKADRDERRAALEERIAERGEEAERIAEAAEEQEALLEDLRGRLADVPDDLSPAEDFARVQGELPWPVSGEVVAEFGESRSGGLQRTGIVVEAELGTDVEAVAPGRVVFSDWLRGLGLLVIIDHGDGFLTLYGHAEALYVDVGEWIGGGDVVATVGRSGTRREPGLYFEIRHGQEPQNPMAWLR